ncbi:MAG: NAD(P)-dependent oxidoreductase [Spirochaetaceae bacterium]|nr:MAG: NAD(P)-dependent oxidoreductase [Spirochaetaceae bacterium]
MKKLLVVGGLGFVGGVISTLARRNWQVHIFDTESRYDIEGASTRNVDITDRQAVLKAMEQIKIDAAINVAAVSNIDFAEKNQELTRNINVVGATNIAEGCRHSGAKYIYFSSDAVFDGSKNMYYEEDPTNPVNYYGRSKAEAEMAVTEANPDTVVIRISLVMGYPVTGGNAFFLPLEDNLRSGKEVTFPTDEIRTPVDVLTLAESVLELVENEYRGVLHIGATDSITRYELACMVASEMGYDSALVRPKSTVAPVPGRAPRHRNGIICVAKAQSLLRTQMLPVELGVRRAVRDKL